MSCHRQKQEEEKDLSKKRRVAEKPPYPGRKRPRLEKYWDGGPGRERRLVCSWDGLIVKGARFGFRLASGGERVYVVERILVPSNPRKHTPRSHGDFANGKLPKGWSEIPWTDEFIQYADSDHHYINIFVEYRYADGCGPCLVSLELFIDKIRMGLAYEPTATKR